MIEKYIQYDVIQQQRSLDEEEIEPGGYLTKFWVNHPKLGRSLVKLDEDTAPGWSEKVVYELAKLLNLPAARYELGIYNSQRNISISPDFKDRKLTYINGDTLIRESITEYRYDVDNSLQALIQNEVKPPKNYQPPEGIQSGADLFVGYLMLDALVNNNDRHGGNWEIGIDNRANKTLAPVYDNGASFGVDFGSLVYDNKTPKEYSETIVSMFGVNLEEAFNRAAAIRPEAAAIWRSQLEKVDRFEIQDLFNRVPTGLISQKALEFAFGLIDQNQQKLLDRSNPVLPSPSKLRQQYLNYKDSLNLPQRQDAGYFGEILQQEREDIAIAKTILDEFDDISELANDKMQAVLSQSDRILKLGESNNLVQIKQYQRRVVNEAKTINSDRSWDRDRER